MEGRLLLCAAHLLNDLPPAPKFDWDVEAAAAAGNQTRGGPAHVDIVWSNRGQASDNFAAAFGTSAGAARAVVDAALNDWARVITNWNRSDGTTTLQVNISIARDQNNNLVGGFGGAGAPATTAPADGKPRTGSFILQAGSIDSDPNNPNGWYFDPSPEDWSEFNGTITNGYAGRSSGGLGPDFYSVVVAELTHVLGLISDRDNAGGNYNGYRLATSSFITNTNVRDNAEGGGSFGYFWTFQGPTVSHLMTSYNSGDPTDASWGNIVHSAGTRPTLLSFGGQQWQGGEDAGNAIYSSNERTLPSWVMTHVLADAYGYSITDPAQFGTFYAELSQSTGNLLVRGGTGASNDTINVSVSGTTLTVSVDVGSDVAGTGSLSGPGNLPAFVSNFDLADVSSITINSGDGNDTVNINSIDAGTSVTVNTGGGNNSINLAIASLNLDAIDGEVTVHGGSGTNTLTLWDLSNAADGDVYTITNSSITRTDFPTLAYDSGVDSIEVYGGSGDDTVLIVSTAASTALNIHGGGGNTAYHVGNAIFGSSLNQVQGEVAISGTTFGGNAGSVQVWDTSNSAANTFVVTNSAVTSNTSAAINYASVNSVTVNCGSGNDSVLVVSSSALTPVIVHGNGGADAFHIGNAIFGSSLNQVLGAVSIFGEAGSDSLQIWDTSNTAANSFTITSTSADSATSAATTYASVESVVVNAGSGNDTINVNSTAAGVPVTVNGGAGNDTLNFGAGDLDTIATTGGVTFDGGDGTVDAAVVNDSASADNDAYVHTTGTVTHTNAGSLSYANAESITINASSGNNSIGIWSKSSSVNLIVNGDGGNDAIELAPTVRQMSAAIPGTLTVNGGGGTDSLVAWSDLTTVAIQWSASSNTITHTPSVGAATTVTYGTVESLSLLSGSGSDSFNLISPGAPLSVNGGSGFDVIRVIETTALAPVTIAPSTGDDAVEVNFDGTGVATALFDASQRLGTLTVGSAGRATVNAGADKLLTVASLTVVGSGKLDLNDNDLLVDYSGASPLATIQARINSARNGGAWNGTGGITSSTAAGNGQHNTTLGAMEATDYDAMHGGAGALFDGTDPDATAVLVKYTWYGDATFDGRVTFDDYVKIDTGFNAHRTGWANGDFNGDGTVNFDDYVLIDIAFNTQSAPLGRDWRGRGSSGPHRIWSGALLGSALVQSSQSTYLIGYGLPAIS